LPEGFHGSVLRRPIVVAVQDVQRRQIDASRNGPSAHFFVSGPGFTLISAMSDDQTADIEQLLSAAISPLGYELLGLEMNLSRGSGLVRLYIDHPERPITVEDCAAASHEISAALDLHDPIPGKYRLEVSSPGLDRPLFKPAHFQRFIGSRIKLSTLLPIGGRRRFAGVLEVADEAGIELNLDSTKERLSYPMIEKARLVPDFAKPAKPGS
jgi:ribosome maturation factor RimP